MLNLLYQELDQCATWIKGSTGTDTQAAFYPRIPSQLATIFAELSWRRDDGANVPGHSDWQSRQVTPQ
jgi:hypothetical protein